MRERMVKPDITLLLSDDLLDLILSKFTLRRDRNSFSAVCKKWYNLHRLSVKSLSVPNYKSYPCCLNALSKYPNLVKLEIDGLNSDSQIEAVSQTCPKLEVLIIKGSDSYLGRKCLEALGIGCPNLSSVVLHGHKIGHAGVTWLVNSAVNLATLELRNSLVGDVTLGVIGSVSLTSLVLERCRNITDHGLELLVNESSSRFSTSVKKLGVLMCLRITDVGVEQFRKMSSLEHLELRHTRAKISGIGVVAISKIRNLKTLKMQYLPDVPDTSVAAIAQNCRNLEELDLQSCQKVTGRGIRAFSTHKCLKRLKLLDNRNVDLSDVESLALGCLTLEPKSVSVDRSLKGNPSWSPQLMHLNTRRVIRFEGRY